MEYLDEITEPPLGSVEEALLSAMGTLLYFPHEALTFYPVEDIELWNSVDGAIEALQTYIDQNQLSIPTLPTVLSTSSTDLGPSTNANMYVGMFKTALEMIEEMRNEA